VTVQYESKFNPFAAGGSTVQQNTLMMHPFPIISPMSTTYVESVEKRALIDKNNEILFNSGKTQPVRQRWSASALGIAKDTD